MKSPSAQIRDIILSMHRRELGLVEGSRQILRLSPHIPSIPESLLAPIRGFESETDHWPAEPDIRATFAADYLQTLDQNLQSYLREVTPTVLDACEKLDSFLSATSDT